MTNWIPLEHTRFKQVDPRIFVFKITPDCMTHTCALVKENNRPKPDACCQYGADVDLHERDAIQKHAPQIRALLHKNVRDMEWFQSETTQDADFPSGAYVRTQTIHDGCIFLQHTERGCAIHRAAIEGNWNINGVKPHVCRLFPLSYTHDAIVISDDYHDYSCAFDQQAPSLYEVCRDTLRSIFDDALIKLLDSAQTDENEWQLLLPLTR